MNRNPQPRAAPRAPGVLVLAVLAAVLTSCDRGPERKPTFPTRGKVTIGGAPAAGAFVVFHPEQVPAGEEPTRAFATVEPDGTYRLTTYEQYDGAPAGSYVVTVMYERAPSPLAGKGKAIRVPPKYNDRSRPRCGRPSRRGTTGSSRSS